MRVQEVGKYRSAWMGVAILWVVLFHMEVTLPWIHLQSLFKMGYGGVDIG